VKDAAVLERILADDGSDVRILLGLDRGGMAHFTLPPGQISTAVIHRTVTGDKWRVSVYLERS